MKTIERPSLMDKAIVAVSVLLIGTIIFCIGALVNSLGWLEGISFF